MAGLPNDVGEFQRELLGLCRNCIDGTYNLSIMMSMSYSH